MNEQDKQGIMDKLASDLGTFIVTEDEDQVLFGILHSLVDVTDLILELNSRYDIDIEHEMRFVADESSDVFAQYDLETFQHILKDYPYESRVRQTTNETSSDRDSLQYKLFDEFEVQSEFEGTDIEDLD